MSLSINLVDGTAPALRAAFAMFARPAGYARGPAGVVTPIKAFVRGVRADDLFGAAAQGDKMAQVDCVDFRTLFGADALPMRYDRVRTMGQSYTVEETRGSPNDDAPVFFKMLLRGGSQ